MEKKHCAVLFNNLDYDKQIMVNVEEYAKFGAWVGETSNTSVDFLKLSNKEWNGKTNSEKELIFNKIATTLKDNTEIISSIEFSRRGISPSETRESIIMIVEYFNYYAKWIHLLRDTTLKPEGRKRSHIKNNESLLCFGWAAAARLAAGNAVEIVAGDNIATALIFIASLMQKTGLPANTLYVISESSFKALRKDYSSNCNSTADYIPFGTVMTVYENSDQDSAVDMAIYATCSRKGSVPWSLKRIIVQETIYKSFLGKLKERLEKLKTIDGGGNKSTHETDIDELNKLLTSRKIDTSMPLILLDNISPYLIEELASREFFTSIVVTQSFRTTKEAVSLINSVPSLALSVWCENQAVSNEISLLANVGCVWQNLLDHISPAVTVELWRDSRKTFLGGKQGVIQEMCGLSSKMLVIKGAVNEKMEIIHHLSDAVNVAKKLQSSWEAMGGNGRSNILIKIAMEISKNRDKYISNYYSKMDRSEAEKIMDLSINYIYSAARTCVESGNQCVIANKKISLCVLKPVGVVAIHPQIDLLQIFLQTVVAVAMLGNAVVYKTDIKDLYEICKIYRDIGLPVVLFNDPNEKDSNGLDYVWILNENTSVGASYTTPHVQCSHLCAIQNKEILEMYFCNRKIIWSSFGETFAN